jgi:hypothetical protein
MWDIQGEKGESNIHNSQEECNVEGIKKMEGHLGSLHG